MAKKTKKASTKSRLSKKSATRSTSTSNNQGLREHLLYLLKGGGAHISFNDALNDWPLQPHRN